MLAGVTLVNPESTYIEPGVRIGRDTVIWPNSYLRGSTIIGEGCEIGPNTIIEDSRGGWLQNLGFDRKFVLKKVA
jgi:bifunctional UDP-N-acetylglucosamine pyrophosphorylase/glucosamine-1-phosphate N-acetyltransferase